MPKKKHEKWDSTPSSQPIDFVIAGRQLPLGWIVLLFPLSIVVFLSLFEGPSWITERSEIGAENEAAGHNTLGMTAMRKLDYPEAYGQFMTALNIMPEYAEAYMNLGILYHLNDDSKNAILNFRKALEIGTKQDDLIYNNLGMVYGEMGDNKTAIEMFERALTSEVKVLPIYRNIAQTYIAMGDYPAAIETYKKAISNHPTSRVLYAEMLLNTKKISEEEDDVAVADSLIQKGVVAEDLEEFDETIIDEYNRKDPKIVEDYLELGKVYETTGAVEEAAESYMKAIDYAQDKSSYYNKLGVLYARNALYDQAYDAFNAAVEHEPGNKEARDNLAQCQRMLTEHSEK